MSKKSLNNPTIYLVIVSSENNVFLFNDKFSTFVNILQLIVLFIKIYIP